MRGLRLIMIDEGNKNTCNGQEYFIIQTQMFNLKIHHL